MKEAWELPNLTATWLWLTGLKLIRNPFPISDLKDCVRPRGLRVGVCGVLRAVGVALLQEGEEAVRVGRPVHREARDGHALHAVLAQRQLLTWGESKEETLCIGDWILTKT